MESHLSHAEMLGLIPADTKFEKRHIVVRYIHTIIKYLADQRDQHMDQDEKPVTAN